MLKPALQKQVSFTVNKENSEKIKDADVSFPQHKNSCKIKRTPLNRNIPLAAKPIHILTDLKNQTQEQLINKRKLSNSILESASNKTASENKENIPNNIGPVKKSRSNNVQRVLKSKNSENVDEIDVELKPAIVNPSNISEASRKEKSEDISLWELCEGTSRINAMPISKYKCKDEMHSRSQSVVPCRRYTMPINKSKCIDTNIRPIPSSTTLQNIKPSQTKSPSPEPVKIKSGYLEKFSDGIIGKWKQRYCILEAGQFSYYSSHTSQKLKCIITFSMFNCSVLLENCSKPTKFQYFLLLTFERLKLPGNTKLLLFRCEDPKIIHDWVLKLQLEISQYKVPPEIAIVYMKHHPKFWKVFFLAYDTFSKV